MLTAPRPRAAQSVGNQNSATAKTTRVSPASPNSRSITGKRTRHSTSHTAAPATGTQSRYGTPLASCNANATPPSSAARVITVTRYEATRLTRAIRAPSRSRTRSNTARPVTAAIRPAISAYAQMAITPSSSTQACDMPKRAPA